MEFGLIGEKLGHSFSKEIHEKIYKDTYELKEICKDDFPSFMKKADFKAINVTIPYKETVLPYLDVLSEEVKNIGCCNTIVKENGKLCGYNTDYLGMKQMILKANITIENKNVYILGSGGTSKTAYFVAKMLHAKSIQIVSRNYNEKSITYQMLKEQNQKVDILINTTPIGMFPNEEASLISLKDYPNITGVIDVIYNPLRTNLILQAKENDIPYCGGLYMLVAQAIFAAALFRKELPQFEKIDSIYYNLLQNKENIVLIGMPSCGKTTIGKQLSILLNKKFIDSDAEIKKQINMEIKEYFALYGESKFREIEEKVITQLSRFTNCIIATGGGAILKSQNMHNLKRNGRIYFINKNIQYLKVSSDRPLSSSKEAILNLFHQRYPLYKQSSDYTINGIFDVKFACKMIIRNYKNERIN